jgi:hypothetical protein
MDATSEGDGGKIMIFRDEELRGEVAFPSAPATGRAPTFQHISRKRNHKLQDSTNGFSYRRDAVKLTLK